MSNIHTESRNCVVSGRITEALENKMKGIFIRSGDTLNFSEQIFRALEVWTAENNSNVGVIVAQNRKKLLEIELNVVYEDANTIISGDILTEICMKLAIIIRTHPKQFEKSTHMQDLAEVIVKSKVISDSYYEIISKEVLLILTKAQKKTLLDCMNRSTGKQRLPTIEYIGGTLDNDNPESEIMVMANNCMTVPIRDGLREQKIQDTINLIVTKYPADKVGDYQACFMNAIEQLESKKD